MKDENAFPTKNSDRGIQTGLTKREYFAGLAMQGLASGGKITPNKDGAEYIAKHAVSMADALLKELT